MYLGFNISSLTTFAVSIQIDVTAYQGVLFIFCMVMFISGLVLAIVLPFQYVSTNHIRYNANLTDFCNGAYLSVIMFSN